MEKEGKCTSKLSFLLFYPFNILVNMMVFLLVPFSIIVFFVAYKTYHGSKFNLPPGPSPWPIIGNLHQVKPVKFRCFADWSRAYGPILSVWYGSSLNVIVSNSKLAQEVLKDNDQQLANRFGDGLAAKLSKDVEGLIWADYGPNYVKLRKLCTFHLFSPKSLEALRSIRENEVMAMVKSIFKDSTNPDNNCGKSLVLRKYLGPMAFNTISRLVFGKRLFSREGEMGSQGIELLAIVSGMVKHGAKLELAENIPMLRWMLWPKKEGNFEHEERRELLIRTIMEEQKLEANEGGNSMPHFTNALLSLHEEYELSEDNKIGLLWDMMTAGMDTTTITVEWAMVQLIKNPRVQRKAQEELDRVIGPNRVMTEADFSNLPYLQCIAKEALRLHPPTPLMLPHRANANIKIGGYDIPKGTTVHVNVWAIARDPAVWREPIEFRPERFMEEDVDVKGRDFRLLPFGAGRRICPATQLGMKLVMSTLGHLLHHFSWTTAEGVQPEEIDMLESPGLVSYMRTPLQAVSTLRLPADLYKHIDVNL